LWAAGPLPFLETLPVQTSRLPRVSGLRIDAGVQPAGVAATGAKTDIGGDNVLDGVSNRLDFPVRRGRVWLSGRLLESIDSPVIFFFDILVERLWRSLKYEEVYPRDWQQVAEARAGIGPCFQFCNFERPDQGLDCRTPAAVYQARA
jgi:hypothetical protein